MGMEEETGVGVGEGVNTDPRAGVGVYSVASLLNGPDELPSPTTLGVILPSQTPLPALMVAGLVLAVADVDASGIGHDLGDTPEGSPCRIVPLCILLVLDPRRDL